MKDHSNNSLKKIIRNLIWKYDDLKYFIKCKLENYFTYYPEYVEGFIYRKDKFGIWIEWSDEDTYISSQDKKYKLFNLIPCGTTFKCKIKWDPLEDKLYKIKDIQILKKGK